MAVALTANIQKHIDEYQKRVGRSYLDDWDYQLHPLIWLREDGSFLTFGIIGNTLEIDIGCGVPLVEGWKHIQIMAKRLGIKKVASYTDTRNPKAYARLVKCNYEQRQNENGIYYYFTKEV
nr:MAG TPA: hypothetical protein [Caudoviricetes sp.]